MIIEFTLSGYKAFRIPSTLSFRAESITENQESLIDGTYLPVVAIFGPNGSGKSTMIEAINVLVEYLSRPLVSCSGGFEPFAPPYDMTEGPSSFSIAFTSPAASYRYSISFSPDSISSERLERLASSEGRAVQLFSRENGEAVLHGSLRHLLAGDLPSDVPLLTLLRSEHPDSDVIRDVSESLSEGFIRAGSIPYEALSIHERTLMLGMLEEMDTGITALDGDSVLYGTHRLPLSEEGDGIKELIVFLPSLVRALSEGRVLLSDSLCPHLHPALRAYVVSLFTSHGSNRHGAMLAASFSDPFLMDIRLLRRDGIYLASRSSASAQLTRLSDAKDRNGQSIRKDARLMRSYIDGEYGAYPSIRRVLRWDEEKDGSTLEKRRLFSINNRRYLGNKFRLTRFIREIADRYCTDVASFADIFSGTGSVSYAFRDRKLILNDFLYSNYLSNLAWFSPEPFDKVKVMALIDGYNCLDTSEDNYMSLNFSDTYFSAANCRRIGAIREDIERQYRQGCINMREKAIIVTSLLYAMDRIAATCGHYDAWRQGADLSASLELRMLDVDMSNNEGNEIFSEDTNALVRHISADIVYIDPPYNSRQYSDAYHLLENVARWEKPEVKGKARKMDRSGIKSDYSTQRAEKAFSDLISHIDASYILLSYNNMQEKGDSRSNAKITDSTIMSVLSKRGEVSVFSTEHRAFSAGKSHISGNEERIFLCRIKQRKAAREGFVESPLNYVGGKGRILKDLLDAFPREIDTFIDLFAGGCTVGTNAPCRRVVFNDSDARLVSLLREMRRSDKDVFISDIRSVIRRYALSQSDEYGYAYYGADSSGGLGKVNKDAYMHLRNDFNTMSMDEHMRAVMLYVLIVYGFNNQIRFNDAGAFNLPVGKRDFNRRMQEKLSLFIDRIKALDVVFMDSDFRTVPIPDGSFVYADPPYLVTTATYNEKHGWTESDETSLHELLESLTERGIRFALSNTLRSRGKENSFLIGWLEKHPEYRVLHLDRSYANSSYHIKDREAESDEVLILNY